MPEEQTTPDLVEKVRRLVEGSNRRDFDLVCALYARDAVWDMSAVGLGAFQGREAIRGVLEDWVDAYDEFELEVEVICDLGNGVTVGVVVQCGSGSTGWVQFRYAGVSTLVDGLIERTTNYIDIDEARAAAERLAEERG
jgi:ketosteroid isomerase-like protein